MDTPGVAGSTYRCIWTIWGRLLKSLGLNLNSSATFLIRSRRLLTNQWRFDKNSCYRTWNDCYYLGWLILSVRRCCISIDIFDDRPNPAQRSVPFSVFGKMKTSAQKLSIFWCKLCFVQFPQPHSNFEWFVWLFAISDFWGHIKMKFSFVAFHLFKLQQLLGDKNWIQNFIQYSKLYQSYRIYYYVIGQFVCVKYMMIEEQLCINIRAQPTV